MTRYSQLIQRLFSINLFGGVKLGLNNCLQLDEALGFPSRAFQSIHIAGTNGKGSVTTQIAKGVEESGYRVGIYTSPHISCFRERIRINGHMIPEESVEILLTSIFEAADENKIPATFFELTTILAFLYFAKENIDIAVLETGLGGRLDATNIVTPKISVITSISLDHVDILGHTIEEITWEKAGIIKPGVPVVIGPRVPSAVIQSIAKEQQSLCIEVQEMHPDFEKENQSIAKKTLEMLSINPEAIEKGLKARPPCRLEILIKSFPHYPFQKTVILDVAHNPDGLTHLFMAIQLRFPSQNLRIICGLSKTKDVTACLTILKKHATHIHLVEASNGRGIAVNELKSGLIALNTHETTLSLHESVPKAVQNALDASHDQQEIIVICGTFFIMREAREMLGIIEPRDSIDINERSSPTKTIST